MPKYFLRPDDTVTSDWAIAGAATAHAAVGRAVTQPDVPANTIRIGTTGSGNVTECPVTSTTLAVGETVDSLTLWQNVDAPTLSGSAIAQIYVGAVALGAGDAWTAIVSQSWRSEVITGVSVESLTQSDIDDLRIRWTKTSGSAASTRAYVGYIEMDTTIVVPSRRPSLIL